MHLVKNLFKINDIFLPIKGYCFLMNFDERSVASLSSDIQRLIDYCCQHNIPHNLFFSYGKSMNELRIFVFVRSRKHLENEVDYGKIFIMAILELSGYYPSVTKEVYEIIDENFILERFRDELGSVFEETLRDVVDLYLK